MRKIIDKHRNIWKEKEFREAFSWGIFLFILSLVANNIAGNYATEVASNSVTDIILNNVPVFNVGPILVYGSIVLSVFIIGLLVHDPKKAPFVLKSMGLFYLIRSLFISMTHLGPFPGQAFLPHNRIWDNFNFGADLFFSGHTGMSFLLALILWKNKTLRYILLACSVGFGVTVLLGHLHYTIDVFAAFFISYAIYNLSVKFFKKDCKSID
ncbi:MAG: phosphatase PAP2-related protein [Candidatus Wolfebacteria bacterium]|nr:phosphatase PAP2-related protein [Candidatus Wolfebacteria bacterium]